MASASDFARGARTGFALLLLACEPSPAPPPRVAVTPASAAPSSSAAPSTAPPSAPPPEETPALATRRQCNAFLVAANRGQTAVNALDLTSTTDLDKFAQAIEDQAAPLAALDLVDRELAKLRDDYAKNLRLLTANVRSLANLQKKASRTDSKHLVAESRAIEKRTTELVNGLNDYCAGDR